MPRHALRSHDLLDRARSRSKKTPGKIVKVPMDCEYNERCHAPTADEDGRGVNHFQTCTEANQF